MNELFAIIASILGILLWVLKSRDDSKRQLKEIKKIISRAQSRTHKARKNIEDGHYADLEKMLDEQSVELNALRGMLGEKTND